MSQVTPGGFDDRMGWSIKMQQKFAMHIYQKYWSISPDDITEVDAHAETETAAQEIDASGIDKVVTPETGVRHIAQRFRTLSELEGGNIVKPDFSIRISTYGDSKTEYDKLLNAYRNGGNVPKIYTFGVGGSTDKKGCLRIGFSEFYFIKLQKFLKLFDSGHIEACASAPNGDGSKALYFSVDSLREARVIQDEISGSVLSSCWSAQDTSDNFPTAPGIDSTGQLELHEFGGGV